MLRIADPTDHTDSSRIKAEAEMAKRELNSADYRCDDLSRSILFDDSGNRRTLSTC